MNNLLSGADQAGKESSSLLGGADQAGKGALYGVMVLASVSINELDLERYKNIYGIKDSKLLTKTKILKIYHALKNVVTHEFQIVTEKQIDNTNLNTLLVQKYTLLVQSNSATQIIIDCPVHNPLEFSKLVTAKTKKKVESYHKADLKYSVVGLASIFAKAMRQIMVCDIIKKTNVDIGSGYPSDPKTKNAYKNYFEILKPYLRHKWQVNI